MRRIIPLKHCAECISTTRGECSQSYLDAPESDLVLPPKPGLLEHGCHWPQPNLTPEVLSISDRDPEKEEQEVQEGKSPTSLAVTDAAMAAEDANEAVSIHSSSSESPTIPSTEQPEEDDAHMADDASASTSSAEEEVIALAIVRPFPMHVPREMKCWRQKMMQEASYLHRMWAPQVAAQHHNPLSPQSNEDRGPRLVLGELSPRSYGNHLLHHPGNHSAAFLNMSNRRPHWQTWPVRMLKIR